MSKTELARKAGVSPITIDRIEKGLPCRLETKRKILVALGKDFSERREVFPGGMAYIKKVCFIGHRPKKLGGYDRNPISDYVKMALRGAIERAIKKRVETFISGGALGVDQWAAEIVLDIQAKEIKKSYGRFSEIKLIIAQPFLSQPAKWPQDAKRRYDKILQKAHKIIAVKDDPYAPWKMQARNEWMVDNSNAVIAVWNGLPGGTENTVKYSQAKGRPVLVIDPVEQNERWILNDS